MTKITMNGALLKFLALYRYWLSPVIHSLFPSGCRFQPTCSEYASEAIATHGAARGVWLALRRLMRCHPLGRSGYDPVPLPSDCHSSNAAAIRSPTLRNPLP